MSVPEGPRRPDNAVDGRHECRFDPTIPPSPCFVVDEGLVRDNLAVLADVKGRTGCRILLALKAFAMWRLFPLMLDTLDGVCASSPFEARLGREEFGNEVHALAAAYSRDDVMNLAATADHLLFNSLVQLKQYGPMALARAADLGRGLDLGIRIHPGHSEGATPIYDPSGPSSRLGVRRENFSPALLDSALFHGVTCLHFHALCEQDAVNLERVLEAVEKRFANHIPHFKSVNFGGGHHITRPGYDVNRLVELVNGFQDRFGVRVYLEPGEAAVLGAGYLVATVLDIVPSGDMPTAILDTAVPAHMPDVIEMPYRPFVVGSGLPGEKPYSCRLGGLSCLAGDVAGEYSFDPPLQVGDRVVFTDMAHYTMVKTNTFNGVALPSLAVYHPDTDAIEVVRRFCYDDFKNRLS